VTKKPAKPKKETNTLEALEAFLVKMMEQADAGLVEGMPMSLTDKMKIADRVLKLEALKAKMDDSTFGSAFDDD
jgi:hypothetical protein